MLRQIVAILFLLLTLFHPLSKVWIIITFNVNRCYIATYLCENRDKPEMGCNGKCCLAKKLRELGEQEPKNVPKATTETLETFYLCQIECLKIDSLLPPAKEGYCENYPSFISSSFISSVFHPPKAGGIYSSYPGNPIC